MDRLFAAATIAAHATMIDERFRQREVRFYIELFANWQESKVNSDSLVVHNTQILRFLESLVNEGMAKNVSRKGHPSYRLTRPGLLELISQLVRAPVYPLEHFFFVFQFVKSYQWLLTNVLEKEGTYFPTGLKVEIKALMDAKTFLQNQKRYVEMEIQFLDLRISDTLRAQRLSESLAREGRSVSDIVAGVEQKYPYDLNNRKPLSELAREMPQETMLWELTKGNADRVNLMWEPRRKFLKDYLEILKKLEKEPGL